MKIPAHKIVEACVSVDEAHSVLNYPYLDTLMNGTGTIETVIIATDGRCLTVIPVHEVAADSLGLLSADAIRYARKVQKVVFECCECGAECVCEDLPNIEINASAEAIMLPSGESFPRPTKVQFPDWRKVLPKEEMTRVISLDVELLEKVCQAIGTKKVTIEISGPEQAMRITPGNSHERDGSFGLLMPMKRDE